MNSYYTDRKMSVIIRQNKGSRRKHKVSQLYTPFRYDFVGSFLRPEYLKKARADYEAGTINAEELKKTEDKAITELVAKQKEAGYHVITDGEFRRATWHLDFMWAFDGVGHSKTETGLPFHGEAAMIDDTYLTGKISVDQHPFVEHFKFVKALEDENTVAKQTIPSPAQFLAQFTMPFNRGCTEKHYPNEQELVNDIVAAYGKVIDDLYAAGCRHHCPGCHNPQSWEREHGHAVGVEEVAERLLTDPFSNITFSGGDPLEQVEAFTELAKLIKNKSKKNIWCYTGYRYEEVCRSARLAQILPYIDVLVDGRFNQHLRDTDLLFRGSSNQRLIDVPESLLKGKIQLYDYSPYPVIAV